MILTIGLRYVGILLQFAVLAVLAQRLTPEDYGMYVLVLSAVLPTYFLVGLGASEAFVRDAPALDSAYRVRQLAGTTLTWLALCAGLVLLAGVAIWFSPIALAAKHAIVFGLALLICNGVLFNTSQLLLGTGLARLGAFFFYPAANIALTIALVPYALLLPEPSFAGVGIVATFATAVAAGAALLIVILKVRPTWGTRKDFGVAIEVGARLAGARALYSVGLWVPVFLAGVLLTPVDAGYLGTAGRLAAAVSAVTAALRFSVRPAIVRSYARHDIDALRRTAGLASFSSFALALFALIGGLLLGPLVIDIVFGPDFAAVYPLLVILLIGVLFEGFGGPVDEVLKMTGSERSVLLAFAIGVSALTIGASVASVGGVIPMAVAQACYSGVMVTAFLVLARRRLGAWLIPRAPIRRGRTA